jgi:hypothetical protein
VFALLGLGLSQAVREEASSHSVEAASRGPG